MGNTLKKQKIGQAICRGRNTNYVVFKNGGGTSVKIKSRYPIPKPDGSLEEHRSDLWSMSSNKQLK